MRKKYTVSLPWVAAAFLAVALPATPSAWAASSSPATQMLGADLPAGVSLKSASVDQVGEALYTASTQQPDMVLSLLEAAIIAKRPPPHHGEISCEDLRKLLKKATAAVPDKARQLLELAISLRPGCDDALSKELDEAFGNEGFGSGLGTNFPGSPGFTGSPPGGATALPPATSPPTSADKG